MIIENYQKEALLGSVMENGIRKTQKRSVEEISAYSISRLGKLPGEYKRFENPHIYRIGISDILKAERDKLLDDWKY
jgi:nicotinate phosphoribosyltransferase